MKTKRLIFFIIIFGLSVELDVFAMQRNCKITSLYKPFGWLSLPISMEDKILKLIERCDLATPLSYLRIIHELINFARTNLMYRIAILNRVETHIVNPLIRFDGQNINLNLENGRDLVVAVMIFRVLVEIRKRETFNFCDKQYEQVYKFFEDLIEKDQLQKNYECYQDNLFQAVYCGDVIGLIKMIIDGIDVNTGYCNVFTALHVAVQMKERDNIVKILIAAGADTDSMNGYGQTALHLAVKCNNVRAIKILLSAGAQVPALLLPLLQKLGIRVPVEQIMVAGFTK